jgi:hypothetical protein
MWRRRNIVVVAAVAVAGVALRAAVVASRLGPVDADEAVVGLMARDILDGRVEAFYWGQEYGGIHEQLLVALLLAVRVPGWLAMELAPVTWAAAAAVLTWRIARRVTADENAALLAGAFVWLSSGAFVWMSTKERGFYGAVLVAGLAALLCALRLTAADADADAGEPPHRKDAFVLGLALGTGWYASPLILHLALPAGLVVLRSAGRPRLVSRLAIIAGGAIAGALPWIAVNLRTGFASLDVPATLPDTTYGDRLAIFFRHALPIASGLKVPFTLAWLAPAARLAYGALLVAVVAVAVLAVVQRRRTWPVALAVLAYPLLYAAFPTSYYFGDPRYLYLLWPMLAVLIVEAAARIHVAVAVAVVVAVTAVGVIDLRRMTSLPWTPDQATHDIAPLDIGPAVDALERAGDTHVYADHWLAQRITFVTDRRVVAAPLQVVRSAADERAVAAANTDGAPVPYLVVAGSCYDRALRARLDGAGVTYTAQRAGRVAVVRPARAVDRDDVTDAWAASC